MHRGTEHVIAYYSKSLNPAQQKYCTTRRELLAVVATLDHFKGYVWGPKFVVRTDHAALVWLKNLKNIQGMLARWLAKLQQFHFEIIHRPGAQHGNADGLSRCPQCERGACAPNIKSDPSDPDQPYASSCIGSSLDSELIPLESGETCVAAVMLAQSENSQLITSAQMTDSDITIVRNWLIDGKFPARTQDFAPASYELKSYWIGRKSLFLDDRNILWRNRSDAGSRVQLVVPRSLRDTIFNDSHHTTYGGHFGKSDMKVHGMCKLELSVHGLIINIDAVVVDLNCHAILGMDVLGDVSKLPFILDLVKGTLSGGGYETIQLHRFQAATECFVETTESACIPPHSEVMLWAKLKTDNRRKGPTAGVVLALQTFVQEFGLLVGRSLVRADADDWKIPVLIYNSDPCTRKPADCTCNPVIIPAQTRIARVEEIQAIQHIGSRETEMNTEENALPPHLIDVLDAATELTSKGYVWGPKFVVRTDHAALVWLKNLKNIQGMLARWLAKLPQFHFEIIHRPGAQHGNADGLSRCPQCERGACAPNIKSDPSDPDQPYASSCIGSSLDSELIPLESGETCVAAVMLAQSENSQLITSAQMTDSDITIVRNWLIDGKFPARTQDFAPASYELKSYWIGRKSLFLDDRNILWRNRSDAGSRAQLVVPRSLRDTIFNDSHHTTYGGHFGITHTHSKLQLHYFWPGMSDFVKDRISAYHKCVARKSPVNRHHPMGHVPVSGRFERVAMDLLDVSVISAKGYKYIVVVCDYFTKYTEAYPLKDKTARSVADALMDVWLPRYGFPLFLHSDQGKEFDNVMIHKLSELLGTVKTKTTPYHPRSDGLVERFNRTLLAMLAMFVSQEHDNWDDLLPFMMLAYNTTVHTSTGFTPYRLVFGDECNLPGNLVHRELRADPPPGDPGTYASWVQQALYESYDEVRAQQQRATHRQKRNYDSKAVARAFPIGCWTLRYYPPARKNKLCSPWIGPYKIVRAPMEWVVGIQIDADARIIYVHMDDLKRCAPPDPEPTWPDAARGTSIVVSTCAPSTIALSDVTRSRNTPVDTPQQPRDSAHHPKSVTSGQTDMRAPTLPVLRSSAHHTKSILSGQIDVRAPSNEENIVKTDTDNDSIVKTYACKMKIAFCQ